MGGLVNDVVEFSSFGLLEDVTGQEAAQEAAEEAAAVQAGALTNEEAQLLLNKNTTLANFDNQKIRNIFDAAAGIVFCRCDLIEGRQVHRG